MISFAQRDVTARLFQVHRRAVPGLPGNRVLHLGPVGEPRGPDRHDARFPPHRLPETEIHQEILLKLQL